MWARCRPRRDSASDCLALLTHLGIERAVVGGMSQGGYLSLRVALTAPERVRALPLRLRV